jgi:hypothetical protein
MMLNSRINNLGNYEFPQKWVINRHDLFLQYHQAPAPKPQTS